MARVVILGGGISGRMMAKRLQMMSPELDVTIIDKGVETTDHIFHLHRTIPEIPELDNSEFLKEHKFQSSVFANGQLKSAPTIKDINDYSYKVFGKLNITNAGNSPNFTIIPVSKNKLVKALGDVPLRRGTIDSIDIGSKKVLLTGEFGNLAEQPYDYLVNTIPMPSLLSMAGIKTKLEFQVYPFFGSSAKLAYNTNTYQQLVITDLEYDMTRVTLFDDELFVESTRDQMSKEEFDLLFDIWGSALPTTIASHFSKIFPGRINILPQSQRKSLLYWLTQHHRIFSLGRYGAWTYKVANDVWEDTEFLAKTIMSIEFGRTYEENHHED